jgi:hypothetical protein
VSIRIYYGDVRKSLLIVVPFVALSAGCGSSSATKSTTTDSRANQSAARFAVDVQAELKRAHFAAAWRTLHPAEKRVVSATRLASCYPRNQFPGAVTFRAREAKDVRWRVPGTADTTDAKEITIAATSRTEPKQTFKQHLVRMNGAWKWMLSSAYFAKAKSGKC